MSFGTLDNGEVVTRHVLKNDQLEVAILSYGATVQSVRMGDGPNMTLGYDTLRDYLSAGTYAGCMIGPVANRIEDAAASLDGNTHQFDPNEAPNCLHSGKDGFSFRNWQMAEIADTHVLLTLTAPDGDSGFPGNRAFALRYEIVGSSLWLTMLATTDADTWVNLTHHGYWNLDGSKTFAGHKLWVDTQHWLAVDDANIPTQVETCPYNFASDLTLPADSTGTIDHNLVLLQSTDKVRDVARLTAPCGISMTIATSEAGLQVYDGRTLPTPYSHIALETQGFPNAPNRDDFPSVRLNAGETYGQVTEYRFEETT
ncbi:aldose epimerase family protein [Algirhabdus cladophorae]|uniref:aldose epimerase family protein n=1 Tax=Algirhabdus cladophorae TaxID=3377108 RepID=UPI003B848577